MATDVVTLPFVINDAICCQRTTNLVTEPRLPAAPRKKPWEQGCENWLRTLTLHTAGAREILISKQVKKAFEIRQLFSLEMALNIHEKGFSISKTIPVCKK